MVKLIVDIYEGPLKELVVTHIFYGRTKSEAARLSEAHIETDTFYKAALSRVKRFEGIRLSVRVRWETVEYDAEGWE